MRRKFLTVISTLTALFLVLTCTVFSAFAAEVPCESAKATGSYQHPSTGAIEDSGGKSSEALGQSMVGSVVDPQALVETAADGQLYLSLRFHLMSNISSTGLSVQAPGDSAWTEVSYESTGKGDDTEDLRIPIPSKDAVVRADCFVDAMGRSVIFYVTVDEFSPGNAGNFARMDENRTPAQTSQTTVTPNSDNGATGHDVVGLVTGGTGNASAHKSIEGNHAGVVNTEAMQEVIISGKVWIMFFVLVFCAQLLACLCFWGIKTLVFRRLHTRKKVSFPLEDKEPESTDFPDDIWDED